MKLLGKYLTTTTITITLILLTLPCFGGGQGELFRVNPKHEVRAVWLATIGGLDWPRCYANSYISVENQKKELTQILDKLKKANINTVLFQTRIRGTVIYPSAIEPWDGCCSGIPGKSPGYDPLAFAIDECHKRGMEIQAWIVAIPIGKWNSFGCKTLRRKHPTLVVRKGNEGYIDPNNPSAKKYIADICSEITCKYDVDGIHLDYIRYPETWKVDTKNDKARQNITDIVKNVYNVIKSIKPWVKLSCAPIGKYSDLARYSSNGWNAFSKGCQDAQGWLRMGIMDQIYPMMYFKGNQFYPFALDWNENCHGRTIVPGLGIYFLSSEEGNWPVDEVIRQMYVARKKGMGYAFFRNKFFCDDTKGLYSFTKDYFNLYPALIPPMTWAHMPTPSAPSNLTKIKSDDFEAIKWDKITDNANGGISYNVYASRTYPVDINDTRNLIAQRLQENHLAINSKDNLYYAVTSMNRYGQESAPVQEKAEIQPERTTEFLKNDGQKLWLPDKGHELDADYIMIKSLAGTIIKTLPYRDKSTDITGIKNGCYVIYSLNSKGIAHRLGFVNIKRQL